MLNEPHHADRFPGIHGARRDAVSVRRELVCETCGYGIRVTVPPLSCPMCQRFEWRPAAQARAAAIHALSARARIPEAVTVAQLLEVGFA
jgi:rubrerythrin